jgi:DNA-binding Lrp family transcriptional regulator
MKLDEQEQSICRELIRNPRLSDNQLAKKSGVPLKTVNRKRKRLEQSGTLSYLTLLDNSQVGTSDFSATVLFMIKFRHGIYRKQLLDISPPVTANIIKHTRFTWLGEQDGKVVLIFMIESRHHEDILEIFNADVIPSIRNYLGHDAIEQTTTLPITREILLLHNYVVQPGKPGFVPVEPVFVSDPGVSG